MFDSQACISPFKQIRISVRRYLSKAVARGDVSGSVAPVSNAIYGQVDGVLGIRESAMFDTNGTAPIAHELAMAFALNDALGDAV